MMSFSSRAEWISITSFISSWCESERSMLMIGVIPEPALMNRSLSGISSGSTNSPCTPPSDTMIPGRPRLTRYGETVPSSTFLIVIVMKPSGRPGSDVSEYARQCRRPLMSSPMRRYWPASWPSHS